MSLYLMFRQKKTQVVVVTFSRNHDLVELLEDTMRFGDVRYDDKLKDTVEEWREVDFRSSIDNINELLLKSEHQLQVIKDTQTNDATTWEEKVDTIVEKEGLIADLKTAKAQIELLNYINDDTPLESLLD